MKNKMKNKDSLNNSIHINTDSHCVGLIYDTFMYV